jgi:hypothetical protein
VKELFLKKFADPVSTGNDVNYEETNEILGRSQKAGQSIEEYNREAEYLHLKGRPVLKQPLAAAVIKGLADEQKRANVSFALDGTTYDFNRAIDKIKASYRSIGELDPFKNAYPEAVAFDEPILFSARRYGSSSYSRDGGHRT